MDMRAAALPRDGFEPDRRLIVRPTQRQGADVMRLRQVDRWRMPAAEVGQFRVTADTPTRSGGETVQALTVPSTLVMCGDVVAVGQRFFCVDATVSPQDRFGFPLMTLRNLETGTSAAIEFRNGDVAVSVLRFLLSTPRLPLLRPSTTQGAIPG